MDTNLFDYKKTFGTDLGMSKAERLQMGESSMTHAMGTCVHGHLCIETADILSTFQSLSPLISMRTISQLGTESKTAGPILQEPKVSFRTPILGHAEN
jgi:hypothetical protein